MHDLKGEWSGSRKCHVANAGDWLVVWRDEDTFVIFQRTGSLMICSDSDNHFAEPRGLG